MRKKRSPFFAPCREEKSCLPSTREMLELVIQLNQLELRRAKWDSEEKIKNNLRDAAWELEKWQAKCTKVEYTQNTMVLVVVS